MRTFLSALSVAPLLGGSLLLSPGPDPGSPGPLSAQPAVRAAPAASAFFGVALRVDTARGVLGDEAQRERVDQALAAIAATGAGVVRTDLYCPDAALAATGPTAGIACANRSDDLAAVVALQKRASAAGLRVAPILHIDWLENRGSFEADQEWRSAYYRALGTAVGTALDTEATPYLELGNEPDWTCIRPGATGIRPGHFDADCVERVRTAVLALREGLVEAARAAGRETPLLAFGVSGPTRWGLTDAIGYGIDAADPTATRGTRPALDWDLTVVHWYDNFGSTEAGDPLGQGTGFQALPSWQRDEPTTRNPAAAFASYGKPIVLTEFGVQTTSPSGLEYPAALPERQAQSFERILTGLYANTEQYGVAGMTAFAFEDLPKRPGQTDHAVRFGLFEHRPGHGYLRRDAAESYARFLAAVGHEDHATLTVSTPRGTALSGRGQPGWAVTVAGGGQPVCETVVGEDGRWGCEAGAPLPAGLVEARQASPRGYVSPAVRPPAAPLQLVSPAGDVASGGGSAKVAFAGSGQPGAGIVITGKTGGTLLCSTAVDAAGAWSCSSSVALAPQSVPYLLSLQQSIGDWLEVRDLSVRVVGTDP